MGMHPLVVRMPRAESKSSEKRGRLALALVRISKRGRLTLVTELVNPAGLVTYVMEPDPQAEERQ